MNVCLLPFSSNNFKGSEGEIYALSSMPCILASGID